MKSKINYDLVKTYDNLFWKFWLNLIYKLNLTIEVNEMYKD